MVSNSKDDHPSKVTPVTDTGIAIHPPATIATRQMESGSSQLQRPVCEKIKSASGL